MADLEKPEPSALQPETPKQQGDKPIKSSNTPPKTPLHQIYALPAPLRTFPLPSFYPNNPLSLFHVVWVWTNQVLFPPPAEPSVIHHGYWSFETRSVHVRDPKSIRALWEQGFFGKGSYSRSEPNWLKREQSRQGQGKKRVAELVTVQRREERKMMKWDRARKEQEAILRTQLQEAWVAPVGPMELLALPNSLQDLLQCSPLNELANGHATPHYSINLRTSYSPANSTGKQTPPTSIPIPSTPEVLLNTDLDGEAGTVSFPSLNGIYLCSPPKLPAMDVPGDVSDNITTTPKRRKSVRFSPKVESTTFQLSDPPNPHFGSVANSKMLHGGLANGATSSPQAMGTIQSKVPDILIPVESSVVVSETVDKEHLQLSPEEAFYLAFGLGALTVTDPSTGEAMVTEELFHLFRQLSYFPPSTATLQPDDPFLVQYAVYHHFRSLGWVPRAGIKFGVDWLLYIDGPVFSHAEFAVTVVPAYTNPYWKSQGHQPRAKSWHWLHSINRVQSHALKTMVLVYVDIPPPMIVSDPSTLLKRYKIREFFMKRWLSNRSR
jgi:tRNA-splicing endonuclease subunit Sen2